MSDPRALAVAYGLTVELVDLGTWGAGELIAEYDDRARAIRINASAIERYRIAGGERNAADVRGLIDLAIAHELYHHREAIGEVPTLPTRALREEAADAYARATVPVDARLERFLTAPA